MEWKVESASLATYWSLIGSLPSATWVLHPGEAQWPSLLTTSWPRLHSQQYTIRGFSLPSVSKPQPAARKGPAFFPFLSGRSHNTDLFGGKMSVC